MKRRIPARYAPILFALLLSCFMSFVVTCIATERLTGIGPGFTHAWLKSWIPAWLVAFPTAFLAAPLVRKIVARLVVDSTPEDDAPSDSSSGQLSLENQSSLEKE